MNPAQTKTDLMALINYVIEDEQEDFEERVETNDRLTPLSGKEDEHHAAYAKVMEAIEACADSVPIDYSGLIDELALVTTGHVYCHALRLLKNYE